MRINTNIMALNTQRQLSANQGSMQTSLAKLSSGLRINSAADDAAGLAISEKMRAQIRGLSQAQKNAQDGISLLQTAEGTLSEVTNILQRMRELANQATNDILSDEDRASIDVEMKQLRDEIDRTTKIANFNGKDLLTGKSEPTKLDEDMTTIGETVGGSFKIDVSEAGQGKTYTVNVSADGVAFNEKAKFIFTDITDGGAEPEVFEFETNFAMLSTANGRVEFDEIGISMEFNNTDLTAEIGFFDMQIATLEPEKSPYPLLHVGANSTDEGIMLEFEDMTAYTGLKLSNRNVSVASADDAKNALNKIDEALTKVNGYRGKLGAYQNRLEYTINSLASTEENLTSAESRIRDVDMAKEMVNFTKNSILNQAATSMLAQANVLPMEVLDLLGTK